MPSIGTDKKDSQFEVRLRVRFEPLEKAGSY